MMKDQVVRGRRQGLILPLPSLLSETQLKFGTFWEYTAMNRMLRYILNQVISGALQGMLT